VLSFHSTPQIAEEACGVKRRDSVVVSLSERRTKSPRVIVLLPEEGEDFKYHLGSGLVRHRLVQSGPPVVTVRQSSPRSHQEARHRSAAVARGHVERGLTVVLGAVDDGVHDGTIGLDQDVDRIQVARPGGCVDRLHAESITW